MNLKRCQTQALATVLTISFVFSPLTASSQTMGRQDPASLLLASLNATNPQDARGLIEQARAMIGNENLATPDVARLNQLIDQAEQAAASRSGAVVADPPQHVALAAGPPPDAADVLRNQLNNAPAVKNTIRELGESRLMRDSGNVEQNITALTGRPPSAFDAAQAADINQANTPGELISYMKAHGLLRADFSADNKALWDQYKGATPDQLAEIIIRRALVSSSVAGATRVLLKILGENLAPGGMIQSGAAFAGLTVEAAATFIINANLTLQMADLYGIRLNSYEEEVAVLAVFAMAKIGIGTGVNAPDFQSLIDKVAVRFADARTRHAGASGFSFLSRLLQNPIIAKTLRNSNLSSLPGLGGVKANSAPVSGPAAPGAAPAPVTPPAFVPPNAVASTTPNAAASAPATSSPAAPPAEGKTHARLGAQARNLVTTGVRVGFAAAWANLETRTVAYVAERTFRRAHQRERATQNDLFRHYLMTPDGDGFFKLMIISVNVGKAMDIPDDFTNPADARVKFILNLAHSARICSPLEAQKWQAAKLGQLNASPDLVQKILRYDCDTRLSQDRYVRLKKEFTTLNEIPQDFVTNLRIAPREDRLRMGELLLQMQFLDGDRSPVEISYFNDVIKKYLGFSTPEDSDYFNRLHGFIVDNGGMVAAPESPSGYTIGTTSTVNPYDLSLGYTATNGPESMTPILPPLPQGTTTNPALPVVTPLLPGQTPVQTQPYVPGQPLQPGQIPGQPYIPAAPGQPIQTPGGVTPGAPGHLPLTPISNGQPGGMVPQVPGTAAPRLPIPGLTNLFGTSN